MLRRPAIYRRTASAYPRRSRNHCCRRRAVSGYTFPARSTYFCSGADLRIGRICCCHFLLRTAARCNVGNDTADCSDLRPSHRNFRNRLDIGIETESPSQSMANAPNRLYADHLYVMGVAGGRTARALNSVRATLRGSSQCRDLYAYRGDGGLGSSIVPCSS